MKKNNRTAYLKLFLRLLFAIILVAILVANLDVRQIYDIIIKINSLVFLTLITIIIGTLASALRLKDLLKPHDVSLSLRNSVDIYFIGKFFSAFLPSTVGGDIYRFMWLSKDNRKRLGSFLALLFDRASGVFAALLISVLSMIFIGYYKIVELNASIMSVLMLFLAVFVVLTILGFNHRFTALVSGLLLRMRLRYLSEKAGMVMKSFQTYRDHPKILMSSIIYSIIFYVSSIFQVYIISRALGIRLDLVFFFLFIPIITIISMIPVSINALGIREGAFIYLFGQVGVSLEAAFSISIMTFLISLIISGFGGIVFIAKKRR